MNRKIIYQECDHCGNPTLFDYGTSENLECGYCGEYVYYEIRIEEFHIGFAYEEYEMDSRRYFNKGMIWVPKVYSFDSPRLHKINEMILNGLVRRKQNEL